jgi:hypothetical protein
VTFFLNKQQMEIINLPQAGSAVEAFDTSLAVLEEKG